MAQLVQQLLALRRPGGVFYGWWLVGVSGVFLAIVIAPYFEALSIWNVALKHEFGWTVTQLNLAWIFARMEGGLMGPIEGWLTSRLGSRRMVLIGVSIMGIGWILFSFIENLWFFYFSYIIISLGIGLGAWLAIMTALNHWFVRKRATAMGISSVITRVMAIPLLFVLAWAIDPDEADYWRETARVIGVVLLLIALPMHLFLRNRPEDSGEQPDGHYDGASQDVGASPASPRPELMPGEPSFTVRQALKTPAFWYLASGHALSTMLVVTIVANLTLIFEDYEVSHGLTTQLAARVIITYLAVWTVFQIVGGYLGDRLPKNVIIFVATIIMACSALAITRTHTAEMAFVFAVLFGLGNGLRGPLVTAIRGDYFGRKAFPVILGLSMMFMSITLIAAPLATAQYRDHVGEGGFILPIEVMIGITIFGAFLFLMARRPAAPNPVSGGANVPGEQQSDGGHLDERGH